mgnify:CR=1 FL=1
MKNEETLFLFAKAIKSLIKKQPLDKITVTDIVSTAGKTRQTFYRHFQDKYDLVIYVADFDTASNYTVRRVEWINLMAANAPWFVQDIPTLFISLANPYHLLDVPMIKTYINGYSHNDVVIQSLVNKLVGKEKFVGVSPVDAFCGKWDTKR